MNELVRSRLAPPAVGRWAAVIMLIAATILFAMPRAQAQGGQRLHGDLAIDGHQPSDGAQTDDAHRRQHDDDQGEPQEDFRRESHAVSFAAHRPNRSVEAVATGAAGARSVAVSLAMSRRCSSETRTSTTTRAVRRRCTISASATRLP